MKLFLHFLLAVQITNGLTAQIRDTKDISEGSEEEPRLNVLAFLTKDETNPPQPYPIHDNDDEKLSENVDVKYFNKLNKNLGETWNQGGHKISFTGSELSFEDPNTFIPDIETILMAHGYVSTAEGEHGCETFVQYYNKAGRDVQVICIDWRNLASLSRWEMAKNLGAFNGEAQNSVDVGWWLGRLLHSLVEKTDLDSNKVHLIGHSLGAHVVGVMGRTFAALSGKHVARVTGLDPAGPLFVRNAYGLKKHMIGKDSGTFVDIIHSNGDFDPYAFNILHPGSSLHYGDLHALGHADFYPNGGRVQGPSGCTVSAPWESSCSHGRAVDFYLHSIIDGPTAFPAFLCSSAGLCSEGRKTNEEVGNHMGEFATKPMQGSSKLYYLDVTTDYGHL